MSEIVRFKMESLHVRTDPKRGLRFCQGETESFSGTILAHLDEKSGTRSNRGTVDLATGRIRLRWNVVATFPLLADALASGQLSPRDSDLVRVSLTEAGRVLEDDSGFQVEGRGKIRPGSILSPARINAHQNLVRILPVARSMKFSRALAAGNPIRCVFAPEGSCVEVTLPAALGGESQRLTLTGGFTLQPIGRRRRAAMAKRRRK